MAQSTQHKIGRVRPPRVQVTYDVEIGDAFEKKELPFVVGVLADLAGKQERTPAKLKERRFVEIDRDNFDDIMTSVTPRLAYQVDNALNPEGGKVNVELTFKKISDFDPVSVIEQVAPLRRLYEARQRLRDLLTKLDGNDELDSLLQEIARNNEELGEIKAIAGPVGPTDAEVTDVTDVSDSQTTGQNANGADEKTEDSGKKADTDGKTDGDG